LKINCDRDILSENISIAQKAVSNRTTLQILECVLIVADEEKGLRIIGNDLEIGVETKSIDAEIIENGSVAIEAKMFSDIIRRLPEGNVTVHSDENNVVTIKCKKSEFKVLGQSGDEFPFLPEIKKEEPYFIQSGTLKNMIRQTNFCVAVDDSKPIMTGELMEIKNGSLKMVAIDGFRVALREAELVEIAENRCEKIVVPSKALNEINKLLPVENDESVTVYISDKHVLFGLKNCILVSRLIEGDFINYENVFTSEYTTIIYANKEELLNSIERTSLISKEIKKSPVKLNILNDKVEVTSFTEYGNAFDELEISVEGMPIEIAFNPRYLIDALKAIDEDEISIQFTTPLSPCIIKSEEVESYKYLVLPLRLKA